MGSLTQEKVIDVLKQVFDPEIPVDVYNFGLIYGIDVSPEDVVNIRMTLTSESCPSARQIPDDIRKKVMQLPGAAACNVEVVWEPRWSVEKITPEGRKILDLDNAD